MGRHDMGDLREIRNFGPYMVRTLNAIGIFTREQLLSTDYRTIRDALLARGVKPHPNIFYSIEMGLQDRVWSSITPEERREVRRILDGG
jgi:hypothetical protein